MIVEAPPTIPYGDEALSGARDDEASAGGGGVRLRRPSDERNTPWGLLETILDEKLTRAVDATDPGSNLEGLGKAGGDAEEVSPPMTRFLHDAQLAAIESGTRKLTAEEFATLWSTLLDRTGKLESLSSKFRVVMGQYDLDEAKLLHEKHQENRTATLTRDDTFYSANAPFAICRW